VSDMKFKLALWLIAHVLVFGFALSMIGNLTNGTFAAILGFMLALAQRIFLTGLFKKYKIGKQL
jgi:hypothetical protein